MEYFMTCAAEQAEWAVEDGVADNNVGSVDN